MTFGLQVVKGIWRAWSSWIRRGEVEARMSFCIGKLMVGEMDWKVHEKMWRVFFYVDICAEYFSIEG